MTAILGESTVVRRSPAALGADLGTTTGQPVHFQAPTVDSWQPSPPGAGVPNDAPKIIHTPPVPTTAPDLANQDLSTLSTSPTTTKTLQLVPVVRYSGTAPTCAKMRPIDHLEGFLP